jgi:hypothetical protein
LALGINNWEFIERQPLEIRKIGIDNLKETIQGD